MGMPINNNGAILGPRHAASADNAAGDASLGGVRWHRWLALPVLVSALLIATLTVRGDVLGSSLRPAALPDVVVWAGFAPVGWSTTRPLTSQVTAQSAQGLDTGAAAYAISTDAGGTWSAWTTAGLSASGATSATQTLRVDGLDLPDAAAANLIRFRIQETDGTPAVSPDYTLQVDVTPPASAVTQPANNAFLNTAPAIAGTATDATSGVAQVEINVRAAATGLYWDGAAWVSGEPWLPATGTVAWTFAGQAPAWADGATYTLRSRATDGAGNRGGPSVGVAFTFDVTPPAVQVLSPNGGELWAGGAAHFVTWAANDAAGLADAPISLSASYDGGATWALIAAALDNSGSYTWNAPAINSNQVLIRVEARDRAGNVGSDRSDAPFRLDSTSPAAPQNLTATPAGWTNTANFALSWTNPPGMAEVAGAWYKLDAPPQGPNDGIFVITTNQISGIVPETDGAHPVYVWLEDALGRADHNAAAMTVLQLDRVAPLPPANLQGAPAKTWTNVNQFSLRWTNPPDLSGIVGAYYRLNQPGFYPTDGAFVATTNTIADIRVPTDGKHDLYIWLVDAAGNVDHNSGNAVPQLFWYDSRPPVSTATLTPAPAATGWYSVPVTVAFAARDDDTGSGVDKLWQRINDAPWSNAATRQITTEGEHVVTYFAQDVAGNLEAAQTLPIAIDLSPPTIAALPDRLPTASGWYTAPVTFTFAVTDAPAGRASAYYRTNNGPWQQSPQVQLSASGVYTIDYFAQDLASNRSPIATIQVKLDTAPPATAYLIQGDQGQEGWYISPLEIVLIPTDAPSGVAATYYRINAGEWQTGTQFALSGDGYYTLAFYSVDRAGNVETSFPVQVKLDTAAPTGPTAVENSPSGWSRTGRFLVQWANPTDLSGIAGVYYRLNQEPTHPTDGEFALLTNRLDGLTVSTEGAHRLYLWLRDTAGNVDHRSRTLAPLLRYDATPPTTVATYQGPAGTAGWYRGPVTVMLTATDAHSGVAQIYYRVNAAAWVTTTQTTVNIALTAPDKHVIEYGSADAAGNVEASQRTTVRIDDAPPSAPLNLRAEPAGWQRFNSFRLTWRAPLDQSGIAGAYVRFGDAPAQGDDGDFFPAAEMIEGLQVPAAGQHTVYVWLRDGAGNADPTSAVALADALWYDGEPPVTTVTRTGAQGRGGWYIGPVAFTLQAADDTSGAADTRYQINDAPWVSGQSFSLTADGVYTVRVASVDVAGNVEPTQVFELALDQAAPIARLSALSRYQPRTRFTVSWAGFDPAPGSGLAAFDVLVRDGYNGVWQNWLSGIQSTSSTFEGQRGHTYFFHVSARDAAGNQQPFTGYQGYAAIETVVNGSFDTGTFASWSASGLLYKAVVPLPGPSGGTGLSARLGSEDYGPSLIDPGQVPVSSAAISQTLRVPDLGQAPRPMLVFWYRVFSYDVLYSVRLQRYVDTFDVTLHDPTGREIALLLRDGNPTQDYGTLYDSGWKQALLDLSPYAGQTVQLVFANHNRHDNLFNTWSYVDEVQVRDWPYSYVGYVPMSVGGGAPASRAAGAVPAAPAIVRDGEHKR